MDILQDGLEHHQERWSRGRHLVCGCGHHEVKFVGTQIKQCKHLGEGAGHARLNYSRKECRYTG